MAHILQYFIFKLVKCILHWYSWWNVCSAHVLANAASKKWSALRQAQNTGLFTTSRRRWSILLLRICLPFSVFVGLLLVLVSILKSSSLASPATLPSSVTTAISCLALPTSLLTLHCNTALLIHCHMWYKIQAVTCEIKHAEIILFHM